jgi:CRISPR-associated protein Csa1
MHVVFRERQDNLLDPFIKRAASSPISEEWRGWNYHNDNLRPPFDDIKLPMYVVAGKYCPTSKDVYMSYIEKKKPAKTIPSIEGSIYHEFYADLIEDTKRYIYSTDLRKCDVQAYLSRKGSKSVESFVRQKDYVKKGIQDKVLREKDVTRIINNVLRFRKYETCLIAANVNMLLSQFSSINKDTLCSQSLPFVVEKKVDGSELGLSEQLSIDGVSIGKATIVTDMKTDRRMDFHRLTTTGYALALELETGRITDIGCVVYPQFPDRKVPVFGLDVHIVRDSLRRWFVEERNAKFHIVAERLEPPLAPLSVCRTCGFFRYCRPGEM